jgi:signal transduction histidine kinase
MKGEITLESTKEGQGTTFSVTIPIVQPGVERLN